METLSFDAQGVNSFSRDSAPLGILPNSRPSSNGAASSDTQNFIFSRETGEIYEKHLDLRLKRYIRQSAARRLLPKNRVSWCLRRVQENQVPSILKSPVHGKCHYGGLISCGRTWECPVCASKISQRRRDELSTALEQWRSMGYQLLLVTYTFPHTQFDNLSDLLKKQDKARVSMNGQRVYKEILKAHSVIGRVRALEITHGFNGWHPHIHEIWFVQSQSTQVLQDAINTRIFDLWSDSCVKHGLKRPNFEHGIDVRDGSYASVYISKWGIEDEITKANSKEGKGQSRNPFQFLDSYILGDKQAGALYVEYVNAFKGKRQLVWTKGLKNIFKLDEKTDEEIAAEQDDKALRLGNLTMEQWAFILSYRGHQTDFRAELLVQAEYGGWDAVQLFLAQNQS